MQGFKTGYQLIVCCLTLLSSPASNRCPLVTFFGNSPEPRTLDASFLIDVVLNSSVVYSGQDSGPEASPISTLHDHEGPIKHDIIEAIQDVYANPSLKHMSTLFALHQLDLDGHGISFFSGKKIIDNKELLGMAEVSMQEAPCLRPDWKDRKKSHNYRDRLQPGQITVKVDNRDLMRSVFAHEASHIAVSRLYKNYAEPYPATFQPVEGSLLFRELMLNITIRLFNTYLGPSLEEIPALATEQLKFLIKKLDSYAKMHQKKPVNPEVTFLSLWCSVFLNYSASSHAAESIVLLPEMLAFLNITLEELPARLSRTITPLIVYWQVVNQDMEAMVKNPYADIINPIETFMHLKKQLNPDQFEAILPPPPQSARHLI